MQGVAKLVQEGLHLVVGEQGGSIGRGAREVHHDRYLRTAVGSVFLFPLPFEFGHPGTGTFGLAGEEVGVDYTHVVTVVVGYLEGLDLGVVYGDFGIFVKCRP